MSDCDPDVQLLIDPPCGPYDPPEVIRAWLQELERMRYVYRCNRRVLQTIDRLRGYAEGWLTSGGHRV